MSWVGARNQALHSPADIGGGGGGLGGVGAARIEVRSPVGTTVNDLVAGPKQGEDGQNYAVYKRGDNYEFYRVDRDNDPELIVFLAAHTIQKQCQEVIWRQDLNQPLRDKVGIPNWLPRDLILDLLKKTTPQMQSGRGSW